MLLQFPSNPSKYKKKRKLLNANRHVGKIIKNYRTDKDLSQRELAEQANAILDKIGTSRIPDKSAISRIESGERELKFLEALALARVLGVHPEELYIERRESKIVGVNQYSQHYKHDMPMAA